MADKKQDIQDGKNIELDGITVINEGITLAEKEEVKEESSKEEAPAIEPEIEITPDVKIADSVAEAEETPTVEAAPDVTIPTEVPSPIAIDIDPVAVDPVAMDPVVSPEPVVVPEASAQDAVPAYDMGSSLDNQFPLEGYNENVVDNRPEVPNVPENVLNAFEMARNEVAEIYLKKQELEAKIDDYEKTIAEKDQTILAKDRQINELSTKVANYESKLSLVRNKVLDEFGLGGMAIVPETQAPVESNPSSTYGDAQGIEINNDISLAA